MISSMDREHMKIWQIDPANLTAYYDRALCRALAEQGQSVRFITSKYLYDDLSYPESFQTDYLYFRRLENRVWLRFPLLRKVLRAISYPLTHRRLLRQAKQDPPDIVHIQWSRLPLFDHWLVQRLRAMQIPIVHTIHDVQPLFSQGKLTGQLTDVYGSVDALIVHTQLSKEQFKIAYPKVDPSRIHIIPLIPDSAPDELDIPVDASEETARQRLGIPSDIPVILFFGAIKNYKGLDVLADALPLLQARLDTFQVWIVGRPGTPEDVRQVQELAQHPSVTVRSDYVPTSDVWLYYYASDVAVFPYRHIFQSAALMTALIHGAAVIVTEVGGLPDLVDGNGWIIPKEDPTALAESIGAALKDKSRLKQMGQRSRELVSTRFAADQIAQQHVELYSRLLDR